MRGKDRSTFTASRPERITPAYAGKSALSCSSCPCGWDHPRVCGEKCLPIRCLTPTPGSPPRVRGKGVWNLTVVLFTGITPACAGKRPCWCSTLCCWWDHPRVCGEKKAGPTGQVDHQGSPPRVRGKVVQRGAKLATNGITPACAGKRDATDWTTMCRRDHPRVCGEKVHKVARLRVIQGSPPRVRGKGVKHRDGRVRVGITPACAGKSIHALLCVPAA